MRQTLPSLVLKLSYRHECRRLCQSDFCLTRLTESGRELYFLSICCALFLTDFLISRRKMMPSDCCSFPLNSVTNSSTCEVSWYKYWGYRRSMSAFQELLKQFSLVHLLPLQTSKVSAWKRGDINNYCYCLHCCVNLWYQHYFFYNYYQ